MPIINSAVDQTGEASIDPGIWFGCLGYPAMEYRHGVRRRMGEVNWWQG